MAYWFCLKHHTVEGSDQDDRGCPNKDRLGPFDERSEAARALERAAERTEEWDQDPNWNDDADGDRTEGER